MAELTQLRLPHEDDYAWYALNRVVERALGCHNCNRRIDPGEPHARGDDDGRRLCQPCVSACWVGERMTAADANRRQREAKIDRAIEAGARMLLDGLEVATISELKRLVDAARAGVVVTVGQRQALDALYPNDDVLLRPGPGAPLDGLIHAQVAGATDYVSAKPGAIAPDATRSKGTLGIAYDTLMSMPKGPDGQRRETE